MLKQGLHDDGGEVSMTVCEVSMTVCEVSMTGAARCALPEQHAASQSTAPLAVLAITHEPMAPGAKAR